MSTTKKFVALAVITALLSSLLITAIPFSVSAYDNSNTYTITGFDTTPPSSTHGSIYVYPNTGSTTRVIKASDYAFKNSKLFIFNASGKLIEAGENIFPNSDTVTGSPQLTVNVPAGGFMVAFGANATGLVNCYNAAMEGAMLYNATMSVIYDVRGSYNKSTNKLTIEYNNTKAPSANAKKFMFVGNSTTYFNGIPIKFKGIAQAAGIEIDVTYCTKGSSYLSYYADATDECGIKIRNLLNQKKFDYVVLQDAGKAVYSQSKPAMDVLMPLIRANGATAVLYKRYASETNQEERLVHAKIHHENYTQLAEDFNIDMVAPVADAYLICDLKYPEINLYADDNAHHSKEGSYLAALVWAITYLGIDINSNSYTADLPEDTVEALKECAVLACEVGYFDAPALDSYENLTSGNSYTISAEPPAGAPDPNFTKLTDGVVAKDIDMTSPYYGDARWVGLSFTTDLREIEVVMPLGNGKNASELYKVTVNAGTSAISGGAHEPNFTVYYSADGKNYHPFGTHVSTDASSQMAMNFSVKSDIAVRATHIKIVFTPYSGNVCRISEITAYGYKTNYTNISVGNPYTISVTPTSGAPSDTDNKELTDGEIVRNSDIQDPKYNDERWVGINLTSSVRSADVIMTVGDGINPVKLNQVTVNFGTDVIGAGITEPNITVYASTDGVSYKKFGSYERLATTEDYVQTVEINGAAVQATHIKVTFTLIDGRNLCRVSEISAYSYDRLDNLTLGNSYTSSIAPAEGRPDVGGKSLTDGIITLDKDIASPTYSDERWVGYNLTSSVRVVDIVIPLGDGKYESELHRVDFNVASDLIGAGVFEPNITVYYSADGSTYNKFGSYERTGNTDSYALNISVTAEAPVKATHIKVSLSHPDKNLIRISEIAAYGVAPALENLSLGSSYTISAAPPSGAPDPDFTKLTDGKMPSSGDILSPYYNDSRWVGMGFSGTVREVEVLITLDGICEFNEVHLNFGSEKIGAGVTEPNATIYYSADGNTYKEFGKYTRTGDTSAYVLNPVISSVSAAMGKYVKVVFTLDNNSTTCRIGEIAVYGTPHEHSADENDWSNDETNHWNECSCGMHLNVGEHVSGDWEIIDEATVDNEGLKKKFCTICGCETESEVIDKLPTPEPEKMMGDLNGNEEIDSVDYALLKRAYFGLFGVDMEIGDINGNEEIDSVDYSLLKRVYFGLYTLQ
ncbi:MAG: hypothetical protein E7586_05955 [Ruminococcaceae bacterium]|nr:hypothetical protein [Oscillospiraceae bacterium]